MAWIAVFRSITEGITIGAGAILALAGAITGLTRAVDSV